MPPADTPNVRQAEPQPAPTLHPLSKICLDFALCCLRKSRGETKSSKKNFIFAPFCPVCLEICHGWSAGGLLVMPGVNKGWLLYVAGYCLESIRKGTPPPIWGATSAFYPHNFSHQKSRKKSPWQDWKKFRKKSAGKCFGERESPQSCRKGARGAKI